MTLIIKLPDPACGVIRELPVLFVDAQLLVLNKPAGIPITITAPSDPAALLPLLHKAVTARKAWAAAMELDYLMTVHRLEPQTSGVWVLARSRDALAALTDQFGSGKVQPRHLALVCGSPAQDDFELNTRLSPHPDRPGEMRSDPKRGKRYHTRCSVLERFRHHTLLRCVPSPGPPGQIAAHLRQARLPLVADPDRGGAGIFLSRLKRDYAPRKDRPEQPLIGRPALHLESLTLVHPGTGNELGMTAPPAKDLSVALKYLRRFAAR